MSSKIIETLWVTANGDMFSLIGSEEYLALLLIKYLDNDSVVCAGVVDE